MSSEEKVPIVLDFLSTFPKYAQADADEDAKEDAEDEEKEDAKEDAEDEQKEEAEEEDKEDAEEEAKEEEEDKEDEEKEEEEAEAEDAKEDEEMRFSWNVNITWQRGVFRLLLIAVDPLTLLDVSQDEAKEAKEDSDDGKTAETEKAASEAMWAVVWYLKNWSKDGSSECF